MSKKLVSNLLSLLYIGDLRILPAPAVNDISDEDFTVLSERKEYKTLIKDGRLVLQTDAPVPPSDDEPKRVSDMNKGELRAYAKSLGLDGLSQANKEELLQAIATVTEE